MKAWPRKLVAWITSLTLALAAAEGCGEGKPAVNASTTEAKVTGKVSVKGVLAKQGTSSFNPANYLRKNEAARMAPIDSDGTYEITTLVGENTVRVGGTGLPGEPSYDSWTYDVKEGTHVYNLELPMPGTRP
jgi:hypothetical protein